MRNKLYIGEFGKKIKIKLYGSFWERDHLGKVCGMGSAQLKIFETEVEIDEDICSLYVDVESIG